MKKDEQSVELRVNGVPPREKYEQQRITTGIVGRPGRTAMKERNAIIRAALRDEDVILIDPKNEPKIEFRDRNKEYISLRGCNETCLEDE